MANFLDVAQALRGARQTGNAEEGFHLVFKALGVLDAAHAKSVINTENLEEVFGAFEMARLCGRLGTLSQSEIKSLSGALRRVIVTTLDSSLRFPQNPQDIGPPRPYRALGDLVPLLMASPEGPVSFITFNYDIALDYMLHHRGLEADYCFGPADPSRVPLMKLHGSVSWSRCMVCNQIVPRSIAEFVKDAQWWVHAGEIDGTAYMRLPVGVHLPDMTHCGHPSSPDPVIVPPTWNKAQYNEVVSIWEHAAAHLAEAENVIVIGYSLPHTDQFFRYLFSIGSISETRPQRFWVIDTSDEAASRFQALLGPVTRGRFRHLKSNFGGVISDFRYMLRLVR
jgi:hypothetical protein